MSKTVVEQSERASGWSVAVVMAAEWEWERTGDKTDRTTSGAAAVRGEREGARERGKGNTSCVKQVAGLLQLDGLKLPKVEISPQSSAHVASVDDSGRLCGRSNLMISYAAAPFGGGGTARRTPCDESPGKAGQSGGEEGGLAGGWQASKW